MTRNISRSRQLVEMALKKLVDDSLSSLEVTSGSDYFPMTDETGSTDHSFSLEKSIDKPLLKSEDNLPLQPTNLACENFTEYEINHGNNNDISKLMSDQSFNILLGNDIEKNLEFLPDNSSIEMYSEGFGNSMDLHHSSLNNIEEAVPPQSSTSKITSPKPGRIRRKHYCVFCSIQISNFARHLERNHSDEFQVQEIFSLEKNSKKRKKLIDKLRREGDFTSSKVVPVRNVRENSTDYIICTFCRGYYTRKSLRRHVKKCFFNTDPSKRFNAQIEGQSMMVGQFGPNDPLRVSGLIKMLAADNVSFTAKKDRIICEVARRYIKSHKEKHLLAVAKRCMRRLSRLLISARKILSNEKLQLIDILVPSKFQVLVRATKSIAEYDQVNRTFKSPTLALQMGTLIKNAVNAAVSLEIQKVDCKQDTVDGLKTLTTLIETDWAQEISSEAGQNLTINRFNKPSLIPAAADIKKFEEYLKNLISRSKAQLLDNPNNVKAYRQLVDGLFCSIMVFNKRRVGELQRMTLAVYQKNYDSIPSSEFEKVLSETEKILFSRLKRVVIRGKRGRGVPVLIDKNTAHSIDFLITHRDNFGLHNNIYLFGLPETDTTITGYIVMRKHSKLALGDQNKASLLTSTKLRKHLGTMAQIFRMDKNDLEQLAGFMGHTDKTHAEWYRLPDDVYQTAKVSKLLMLSKQTGLERFKGRSLDEIEVDDYLVEEGENEELQYADSDNENEELNQEEEISVKDFTDIPSTSTAGENSVPYKIKKGSKRTLVPWTTQQKQITEDFFKRNIKNKIPPKKAEVMTLIDRYPRIFENKTWPVIKIYVCNKYNSKK